MQHRHHLDNHCLRVRGQGSDSREKTEDACILMYGDACTKQLKFKMALLSNSIYSVFEFLVFV
jgi:hypothetical protein